MKHRRNRKNRVLFSFAAFLLILCICSAVFLLKMRPVILNYSQSVAERILLNAANEAVVNVLRDNDVSYEDIVRLSKDDAGRVTSLQIDALNINMLKSKISLELSEIVAQNEEFHTYIPIGTFFGSEYTTGLGPKIEFSMQLTSTCTVDFEYEFTEAGLNQVIHRVLLHMKMTGRLVMRGAADVFTVESSELIAETVIVGLTPDAFTQVIQGSDSDTADVISNYGADTDA